MRLEKWLVWYCFFTALIGCREAPRIAMEYRFNSEPFVDKEGRLFGIQEHDGMKRIVRLERDFREVTTHVLSTGINFRARNLVPISEGYFLGCTFQKGNTAEVFICQVDMTKISRIDLGSAIRRICAFPDFGCFISVEETGESGGDDHLYVYRWNEEKSISLSEVISPSYNDGGAWHLSMINYHPAEGWMTITSGDGKILVWTIDNHSVARLGLPQLAPAAGNIERGGASTSISNTKKFMAICRTDQQKDNNSELTVWDIGSGRVVLEAAPDDRGFKHTTFMQDDSLLVTGNTRIEIYSLGDTKSVNRINLQQPRRNGEITVYPFRREGFWTVIENHDGWWVSFVQKK